MKEKSRKDVRACVLVCVCVGLCVCLCFCATKKDEELAKPQNQQHHDDVDIYKR